MYAALRLIYQIVYDIVMMKKLFVLHCLNLNNVHTCTGYGGIQKCLYAWDRTLMHVLDQ